MSARQKVVTLFWVWTKVVRCKRFVDIAYQLAKISPITNHLILLVILWWWVTEQSVNHPDWYTLTPFHSMLRTERNGLGRISSCVMLEDDHTPQHPHDHSFMPAMVMIRTCLSLHKTKAQQAMTNRCPQRARDQYFARSGSRSLSARSPKSSCQK